MPCLNEEKTIGICIKKAQEFLTTNNISGQILIADNGSIDNSKQIALSLGADVINVNKKGYGSALIQGSQAAAGEYIIMGDADDSYDFLSIMPIYNKLLQGYDLVVGNRFWGGIDKGAMPWSHYYIGNPFLSWLGGFLFPCKIRDFHCGLRGYNKDSINRLNLKSTGMEYASEMIIMAYINGLKLTEVPTHLYKDGRNEKSHLNSIPDGLRHIKCLLSHFIFKKSYTK